MPGEAVWSELNWFHPFDLVMLSLSFVSTIYRSDWITLFAMPIRFCTQGDTFSKEWMAYFIRFLSWIDHKTLACVWLIFTIIAKRFINLESKIHCATSPTDHEKRWMEANVDHTLKAVTASQKSLRHTNTNPSYYRGDIWPYIKGSHKRHKNHCVTEI